MRQKSIHKSSDGTDLVLVKSHIKDLQHSCEKCYYDHNKLLFGRCPTHKESKNSFSDLLCIKKVFGEVEFFEFHKAF